MGNVTSSSPVSIPQVLTSQSGRIASLWKERVRDERPEGLSPTHFALADQLPTLLGSLELALRRGDANGALLPDTPPLRELTARHPAEQIVIEYQALREVLFEVLEEGGALSASERRTLRQAFDQAVREVTRRSACGPHGLLEESTLGYGVICSDPDGRITGWSAGAERLTGYAAAEVIGQPITILYTPEDREHGVPEAELQKARIEGKAEDTRWHLRKDGSRFFSTGVVRPLGNPAVDGFGKIIRDISRQHETEETLREREELVRRVSESSFDCIKILDLEGHLLWLNEAGQRQLEIADVTQHVKTSWIEFWTATDREAAREAVARARNGEAGRFEGFFATLGGTPKWWDVVVTPMFGADGKPERLLSISRDITDRKQKEEALQERARIGALAVQVGATLSKSAELPVVLQEVSEALVQHLDGAFARIWTVNHADQVLELQSSAGMYTHRNGPHSRIPVGQLKIGRIAETRKPHLTNDVQHDPRISDPEWARREGMIAFAGFPLLVEERVVGVLALFSRHVLSDYVLQELAAVGHGVAQFIERKRIEDERLSLLDRERAARTEADLERQRLRTLLLQAPALIAVMLGPKHTIQFANDAFSQLFGRRDLEGKAAREALPDLEGQPFFEWLDQVYRTGEPHVGKEIPARWCQDGVEREGFFSFIYQPIRDGTGAVYGIFVHAVEVTDEVLARRRVEALAAERAAILRGMVDGVIISDATGRIAFVNDAARRIHGTAELGVPVSAYAETYHLFTLNGESYPPEELPLARAVLRGETVVDAEWRIRRPGGTEIIAQGSATPILAEDGARLGAVLLVRDVTAQRELQHQREQLLAELEMANERKDQFLATLAHELRNPLAPIRTAVEVMRLRETGDPALEKARNTIDRQVEQLTRLVDDLLDVARITRGKIELRREPVDLGLVVTHAVQTARPAIDHREQHLSVSLPMDPVYLEADPTRLEQVITNLLTNAAKFTPPHGQIWVTAECELGSAVVRVRDTGKGIPPEMLPHIFDLFTQVNPTIDRAEGGIGLGLTLVRNLVEMHGGTVEAQSAGAGKGSEFIIRLPSLPPPRTTSPDTEQTAPDIGAPGRRVLIVDDNVDAAETLADLLPLWGHEVKIAHSGPAALQAAAEFRPEVILLDIGLPGMDGFEVTRRVREDPSMQAVRLIAVTGFGQEQDRRRSADAGFDDHLVKPVDLAELRRLLAEQ